MKLKGNCRAKPLMLQSPFNQARTTEMQMLTMAARRDLPRTSTLTLGNLCSPDETEHFCQIQSARQHQIARDLLRHIPTERLSLRLKVLDTLVCSGSREAGWQKPSLAPNLKGAKSSRAAFTGRSDRRVDVSSLINTKCAATPPAFHLFNADYSF